MLKLGKDARLSQFFPKDASEPLLMGQSMCGPQPQPPDLLGLRVALPSVQMYCNAYGSSDAVALCLPCHLTTFDILWSLSHLSAVSSLCFLMGHSIVLRLAEAVGSKIMLWPQVPAKACRVLDSAEHVGLGGVAAHYCRTGARILSSACAAVCSVCAVRLCGL